MHSHFGFKLSSDVPHCWYYYIYTCAMSVAR